MPRHVLNAPNRFAKRDLRLKLCESMNNQGGALSFTAKRGKIVAIVMPSNARQVVEHRNAHHILVDQLIAAHDGVALVTVEGEKGPSHRYRNVVGVHLDCFAVLLLLILVFFTLIILF